jgi:MFS family permease
MDDMTHTEASAERDARLINARHHGDVRSGDIAIGVIIGRTSEFFDFFVYAIASVIVFPRLVFPFVDPVTGTLYSFTIFALAFAARPLGTSIFNAIDRTYGRSAKLSLALFMLGTSTVAIGFLPSYERIGLWAAAVLTALRVLQGIAVAGTWDGLAPLLALNAPKEKRGWYAMIPQLGAAIGLLVASLLFAFFVGNLSAADFYDWGWRYPFFVAFAINVVALFARLRIVVTPEYTRLYDERELKPVRIRETLRAQGRTVLTGAFAPLASFALFHMVTVFPLSWVFLYTREAPSRFLLLESVGAVVFMISIMVSGRLSDRFGRARLLQACAVAIAVFSGFAPQLLDAGLAGETFFMLSGFVLLGLSFGQSSGAVASNFQPHYRYTGSALTSDLAWIFGAGLAPLAGLVLASQFGLLSAGAYLLSGAICTLVALRFASRRNDMEV